MMRFISNNVVVVLSILMVGFYLLGYVFLGAVTAKFVIDSLALGAGVVIMGSWFPSAIIAFRNGARSAANKINIGIWGTWTILVLQRLYVIVTTLMGKPDWATSSIVPGVITTCIFIIASYIIAAPVQESPRPNTELVWIGIGIAAASALFGLSVGLYISQNITFGPY